MWKKLMEQTPSRLTYGENIVMLMEPWKKGLHSWKSMKKNSWDLMKRSNTVILGSKNS